MATLEQPLTGSQAATAAPAAARGGRDRRIDFFRGLALLIIFIDHIPENVFALITLRNFGFSDAAEIFIFLSGYSAGYVFGLRERRQGFVYATVELLRRVWTLYVVHIFVFVLFIAEVSFAAAHFRSNPLYLEEMRMTNFLEEPHIAVIEALMLRFQPTFLDILPLYITLLLGLAPLMALFRRASWACVVGSGLLWLGVQVFDWHLTAYPDGRAWTFNPLAWQFLFVIGAFAGRIVVNGGSPVPTARWLIAPVVLYLAFAFVIGLSWTVSGIYPSFPGFLSNTLWPIDKPDLSPWRLAHFLALAYLVAVLTRGRERWFAGRLARPIVRCGEHSLAVFCTGIFLSLLGHLAADTFNYSLAMQLVINAAGCAIMIGLAWLLDWYKKQARGPSSGRPSGSSGGTMEQGVA
ncbi:MAG TPA: OpgC domain-containing protein [Candidatus Sulfotelmatobacter sp.]|nr:OpgC domain-containing protein [Candidatus Sulfotelmatobacter sp.]